MSQREKIYCITCNGILMADTPSNMCVRCLYKTLLADKATYHDQPQYKALRKVFERVGAGTLAIQAERAVYDPSESLWMIRLKGPGLPMLRMSSIEAFAKAIVEHQEKLKQK